MKLCRELIPNSHFSADQLGKLVARELAEAVSSTPTDQVVDPPGWLPLDKGGLGSSRIPAGRGIGLRFPRFMREREDKPAEHFHELPPT